MATYDQLDFHILTSITIFKRIKFNEIIDTYKFWEKPRFETKRKKRFYFIAKRGVILHRMKKFMKEELVFVKKDEDGKSNIYVLNKQKVKFLEKHKFIDSSKKAIWIKEKDGTECIFSL